MVGQQVRRNAAVAELRAGVLVAVAVVVVSALLGVVWGRLVPGEQLLVVEPGRGSVLTGESAHEFDAVAIFACFGAALGVLSAFAAWRWRSARGPLLQVGLLLGSLLGAFVMARLGEQVAAWQYPRPHNPPVGQIVTLPVEMGSWLALIVQPLFASLVVMFLAALNSSDDLGVGPRPGPGFEGAAAGFEAPATYSGARAANSASVAYGGGEPAGEAGSGSSSSESRPGR
ncbi:DUF2567 domain-containing protein [Nocardia callitridis]|uniref:DUF2567 domain-containing protein n=1 Tax=Nocardia callitridis TaxID=648753 RepID=A0ABP9KKZ3_9NOCA